jgi:hypothetical protein
VKTRFQNLPFKSNLQRYTMGGGAGGPPGGGMPGMGGAPGGGPPGGMDMEAMMAAMGGGMGGMVGLCTLRSVQVAFSFYP